MKDLIGGSTLGATGIEAMDGMTPANLPCADTAPDDSISRDRLRQLANEIGPRDFAETADLFLMEVEVALDALSTVTAPNLLIDELHFLKGCALNLGNLPRNHCRRAHGRSAGPAADQSLLPGQQIPVSGRNLRRLRCLRDCPPRRRDLRGQMTKLAIVSSPLMSV